MSLERIVARLRRHREVAAVDPGGGGFTLIADGRPVRVDLPRPVLAEYWAQLDEQSIPEMSGADPERCEALRAAYVALWIEELVDADAERPVQAVHLRRDPEGAVLLEAHRGRRDPAGPDLPDGLSWKADDPRA